MFILFGTIVFYMILLCVQYFVCNKFNRAAGFIIPAISLLLSVAVYYNVAYVVEVTKIKVILITAVMNVPTVIGIYMTLFRAVKKEQ